MHRNGKTAPASNGTLLSEPLPRTMPATLLDADAPAPTASAHPGETLARSFGPGANHSIAAQLLAARMAIESVLSNTDVQAALEPYGYDATRMREGRALYEQALALHQQQQAGRGDRYAATDARDAAQAHAHAVYIRHLAVARVALRGDRGAAQALGLASRRKKSHADWLAQAQQFYANALASSAIRQRLAPFGAGTAQLMDAQALVAAVAASLVAQGAAREAAQALTEQRDAALDALRAWMRDFRAIARVALG